jgi:hypothetical protein
MTPQKISDESLRPGWFVGGLAWLWVRLRRIDEQKYKESGWDSYAEKLQFKFLALRYGRKFRNLAKELKTSRISARNFGRYCNHFDPARRLSPNGELTFKHSGTAGDIIYSLPTIKALSHGRPVKLFLNPYRPDSHIENPLGKLGLNVGMARLLIPLLEHQPWLASVQIYNGEPVDYDLDLFRKIPSIRTGQGSIAHWYFWMLPVSADLSKAWLEAGDPPLAPSRKIVVARSPRYRNLNLDYAFLSKFGEIDFIGTPAEFEEMKLVLPELRHVECKDFLEVARVIQAAHCFIGNQSFPFALAEALKVPRILEVCPRMPDVIPTGGNFGVAYFQPNFERLAEFLWENS